VRFAVAFFVACSAAPLSSASVADDPNETARKMVEDVRGDRLHPMGHAIIFDVRFESSGDAILSESEPALDQLRAWIVEHPRATRVLVASHASNRGTPEYNLERTRHKAATAVRWLLGHGVDCHRVLGIGWGILRPIADGPSELQDRTELAVLDVDGVGVHGADTIAGDACQRASM
jgi:outer membrane protein OmpA-like peptidoglycan-associated protein